MKPKQNKMAMKPKQTPATKHNKKNETTNHSKQQNKTFTKAKQKGDEAHRSRSNDLLGNNIYTWGDPPIRPRVSKTLHNSYRNPQ
jgi:hypothetical protein